MAGSVAHARTAAASAGVTNDPPLLFCLPATNRSTRSEPAQSVEVRTPRAVRIRAPVGTWQTATLETEFCGQRLSTARAANEPQRRWNGLGRPTTAATSRGNVVLFCRLGNHVDLRGLPGGAEGNRTPDLCSAIAALSHLSYSPVARVSTCAPDACQRRRRGAPEASPLRRRSVKGLENSCVRSSTSSSTRSTFTSW
jgi:hypothetical protein